MSEPQIKGYEELYTECDQCGAKAQYAFCEHHYNELIHDAIEDGRAEEKVKVEKEVEKSKK